MAEIPTVKDLLAELAKDPKALLAALQEIDSIKKDNILSREEIMAWIGKHANELVVQGHKLADDLASRGESALKAETLEMQRRDPNGPAMTQEFMQAWYKAAEDQQFLQREVQAIAESLEQMRGDAGMKLPQAAPQEKAEEPADPEDRKIQEATLKFMKNALKSDPNNKAVQEIVTSLEKVLAPEKLVENKPAATETPEEAKTRQAIDKYEVSSAENMDLGALKPVITKLVAETKTRTLH